MKGNMKGNMKKKSVKYIPASMRVLVRARDRKMRTESGLYLPEVYNAGSNIGDVEAVGDGAGTVAKVGDVVIFAQYAGCEIPEEKGLFVMKVDDILCTVAQ